MTVEPEHVAVFWSSVSSNRRNDPPYTPAKRNAIKVLSDRLIAKPQEKVSLKGRIFPAWPPNGHRREKEMEKSPRERAFEWLRGQDLNLGPSGYEPDELPDCSTPRRESMYTR